MLSYAVLWFVFYFFFFFKQKTAYEMRISDWSSDVCSSDLHIRVVGPFRFDLLGLGLQFREPRLLLGSARDWHAVNLAQAVGNTPGQVDGGRDPLPALGADLLAFDLTFFGDQPVEERGIGQPAAIVLLDQVAHHAAAGLDIGLDPDEPHPLVRDAHAVLGQLLPDIGARPVVAVSKQFPDLLLADRKSTRLNSSH